MCGVVDVREHEVLNELRLTFLIVLRSCVIRSGERKVMDLIPELSGKHLRLCAQANLKTLYMWSNTVAAEWLNYSAQQFEILIEKLEASIEPLVCDGLTPRRDGLPSEGGLKLIYWPSRLTNKPNA